MKKLSGTIALLFLIFTSAFAQGLSVDEILENYFEAIGSPEAWKGKTTMKITGTSENMGMSFPVTVYAMPPNLQKVEVNIQGQQYVEAFDGEVAWTINPFMGSTEPTQKTEDETKEAAKQKFEDEFIDWKEKGHSLSLEGTEEVDGVETIKLKMVKNTGDEVIYFFDPENYVPIMMRSYISSGPMKGKAVDSYMSDYQEVDDVVTPFSLMQKVDGQTFMNMKMEKVEFNVPMEKSMFEMPKKD
jgi:hypothetical protein